VRHIIGYVRVTTEERKRSGLCIEAHTDAISSECKRRGRTVEIVADLGRFGKNVNPELRKALDLLGSGQADGRVVAMLDRLALSIRHASAIVEGAQALKHATLAGPCATGATGADLCYRERRRSLLQGEAK
jgi:DNA invertase Pin-like site-specific DNA recombinase